MFKYSPFNLRLVFCISTLITTSLFAEETSFFQLPDFKPSQMDFGGVGLMQMPSGRMAEEGTFSFGYSDNEEYQFYTLSLQLMPWLETTLRYTQVTDVLFSSDENFSGDTNYADKSVDTKFRLLNESRWTPEVSIGLRDLGGTGLFDGEFIAVTKRLATRKYGQFDFTLGLGWGYLGGRENINNPLCSVYDYFCSRGNGFSDNGGSIDYRRWFTGSSSLFGGVEYQTPHTPLRIKLEYDGNDYSEDLPSTRSGVDMVPKTPWNIGAVYSFGDSASIRLSYERGTTVALGVTFSTNFDSLKTSWVDEPNIPMLGKRQLSTLDDVDWNKVDNELDDVAGYQTEKVYLEDNKIVIAAKQTKYRDRDIAVERAAGVLASYLPDTIDAYRVIEQQNYIPMKSTEISAQGYQDLATVDYFNPSIQDALIELPPERVSGELLYDVFEPLSYGIAPHLSQSFGNPESFYIYSVSLNTNVSYWINSSLELSSSAAINLVDNYDQLVFDVPSDGTSSYRVRTLVRAYVRDNDAYLNSLQLTWFEKYGKNWYQQIYAGYLETMFFGIGSEVLYRQPNSNWAVGADINAVSQRDPSSIFGIFSDENDYGDNTKVLVNGTTGHLSIYYQPEWLALDNTLFRLDLGKFLATDVGARFDFSKQYKSGVIVGAYASITDLSAEDFGEGSFTKGFYLSIPFDAIAQKPTTTRGNFNWQPILRDGGQKLGKRNSLFNITDAVSPWYQRPNQNE